MASRKMRLEARIEAESAKATPGFQFYGGFEQLEAKAQAAQQQAKAKPNGAAK